MDTPTIAHETARRDMPPLFERDGPLTARAAARAGAVRPGAAAAEASAASGRRFGLRLLLDRLQSQHPSSRRRGRRPDARRRLSGEPRHGLSQGLGSARGARRARSRDDAARCETRPASSSPSIGTRRSARSSTA